MRRYLVLTSLTLVVALLPNQAMAASAEDFVGVWASINEPDGSNVTITISIAPPPGQLDVVLFDDGASVCDPDAPPEAPDVAAEARGRGTVDGNDLVGTWRLRCLGGHLEIHPVLPFVIRFLNATHLESGGVIYTKVS